jgi:hypothetical protein
MGRPPGSKYDIFLKVRLDADLQGMIAKIADGEDRPVSQMARVLLREAVEARKQDKKRRGRGIKKGETKK